jgi:CPA2 family monovalent cation:H+ antiporter-2
VAVEASEEDGPVPTKLTDHTILIGYGRVGSLVGKSLKETGLPFLVIEDADKTLARLNADGIETVAGNAANSDIFALANPAGAKRLILAIPNAFEAGQIIQRAKAANPSIKIIARAHSDAEVEHLKNLGADMVIMGEREIARGIVEQVLETDVDASPAARQEAKPDEEPQQIAAK